MRSRDPIAVVGKEGLEGLLLAELVEDHVKCDCIVSALNSVRPLVAKFFISRKRLEVSIGCMQF
jgi:hypothetical protein